MIDTLKLQRAGFSDAQIEALAELVTDQVATKADVQLARAEIELKIEELRRETREMETSLVERIEAGRSALELKVEAVRNALELKIEGTRAELELRIEAVRTQLELKIEGVRTELHREMSALAWKLVAALIAQAAAIVALIKLLPGG